MIECAPYENRFPPWPLLGGEEFFESAELDGANKRCTALTCSAQEDLRTHAHVNILNAQARWSMVAETRRSTLEINIIKHRLKGFESINI